MEPSAQRRAIALTDNIVKQEPPSRDAYGAPEDLLLTLSQMQMQLEESRTQGIHARGVGLGGFASVVLSLLALALSSDARALAPPEGPDSATYMLVGALVILAAAVALIVGVMWPYDRHDIRAKELDTWRNQSDPSAVRTDALRRLSKSIRAAQRVNHRKAIFLLLASILIVVAVTMSAAAGAVIAL
jgi:hypothetical protein